MAPKAWLAALMLLLPLGLGGGAACSDRNETAPCVAAAGAAGEQSTAGGQAAVGAGGEPSSSCQALGKCAADLLDGAVVVDGRPQSRWTATAADACFDAVAASAPAAEAPCHDVALNSAGDLSYAPDFLYSREQSLISVDLTLTGAIDHDALADASIVTQVSGQFTLTAACRAAQPMLLGCAELAKALRSRFEASSSAQCVDDGDGGCRCDYDLRQFVESPDSFEASAGSGAFQLYGSNVDPTQSVEYCLQGDTLALTARAGLGLFTRLPYFSHLRTLVLHRATVTP